MLCEIYCSPKNVFVLWISGYGRHVRDCCLTLVFFSIVLFAFALVAGATDLTWFSLFFMGDPTILCQLVGYCGCSFRFLVFLLVIKVFVLKICLHQNSILHNGCGVGSSLVVWGVAGELFLSFGKEPLCCLNSSFFSDYLTQLHNFVLGSPEVRAFYFVWPNTWSHQAISFPQFNFFIVFRNIWACAVKLQTVGRMRTVPWPCFMVRQRSCLYGLAVLYSYWLGNKILWIVSFCSYVHLPDSLHRYLTSKLRKWMIRS